LGANGGARYAALVAISSSVFPVVKLRATRASAGVKSNSDVTSSTGGPFGSVTGVSSNTPAQRANRSREDLRIGMTWATIAALVSAPRTAKERAVTSYAWEASTENDQTLDGGWKPRINHMDEAG
jgi:hypothetical protein